MNLHNQVKLSLSDDDYALEVLISKPGKSAIRMLPSDGAVSAQKLRNMLTGLNRFVKPRAFP